MEPMITRHRPKTFADFFGNEAVVDRLRLILENPEKAPRAFLITGHVGCGKTTLARIMARKLNNVDPEKDLGRFVLEYNAGSYRGIETFRKIIADSYYSPVAGEYKIHIIDEAHATTPDAQEAFLKRLEEPGKSNVFILSTNKPEKLKEAVRSRCTTFDLSRLSKHDVLIFLKQICKKEEAELPENDLSEIAKKSKGVPREALKLLDEALMEQQIKINPELQIEKEASYILEREPDEEDCIVDPAQSSVNWIFILQDSNDIPDFKNLIFEQAFPSPIDQENLDDLENMDVVLVNNSNDEGREWAEHIEEKIWDAARSIQNVEPIGDYENFGDMVKGIFPNGYNFKKPPKDDKEGIREYMNTGVKKQTFRNIFFQG